jgi:hypothetical protein
MFTIMLGIRFMVFVYFDHIYISIICLYMSIDRFVPYHFPIGRIVLYVMVCEQAHSL